MNKTSKAAPLIKEKMRAQFLRMIKCIQHVNTNNIRLRTPQSLRYEQPWCEGRASCRHAFIHGGRGYLDSCGHGQGGGHHDNYGLGHKGWSHPIFTVSSLDQCSCGSFLIPRINLIYYFYNTTLTQNVLYSDSWSQKRIILCSITHITLQSSS